MQQQWPKLKSIEELFKNELKFKIIKWKRILKLKSLRAGCSMKITILVICNDLISFSIWDHLILFLLKAFFLCFLLNFVPRQLSKFISSLSIQFFVQSNIILSVFARRCKLQPAMQKRNLVVNVTKSGILHSFLYRISVNVSKAPKWYFYVDIIWKISTNFPS